MLKTLELKDFKKVNSGFIFNLERDLTQEEWAKFKGILSKTIKDIKKVFKRLVFPNNTYELYMHILF